MEFRTEYNLTLSTSVGRALIKALVDYQEKVMGTVIEPCTLPEVFEVPGVLRIENLVIIEDYSYSQVTNPIRVFSLAAVERPEHLQQYAPKYEPRREAELEECALNVKFAVWQRVTQKL
ncbi:hypothetical protein pEaSNUABM34_00169 [Erwinia phage pEa_SNUABM_34]|nr:hypothetical protein pEaSNUABM34_00169 [Erwinia phage pEa_SNUABM_34]